MRVADIIEWVLILGALFSLWPVIFLHPNRRPDWYAEYLIGVLAVMAVVAIVRIRRLRRALRDQQTK
jgi:hypothetical protein